MKRKTDTSADSIPSKIARLDTPDEYINNMLYTCLPEGWIEKLKTGEYAEWFAANGWVACLSQVISEGSTWGKACALAAANGHINCLEFAIQNGCLISDDAWLAAAANGRVEVLKFLWQKEIYIPAIVSFAAAVNGKLNCLQWAHEQSSPSAEDFYYAILGSHDDCIDYLMSINCPVNEKVVEVAASTGSVYLLRYLIDERRCSLNVAYTEAAALAGNLANLRFLHLLRCPWDSRTTDAAALRGSLDCLKFAVSRGCREALVYALENGCPWSESTVDVSIMSNKNGN